MDDRKTVTVQRANVILDVPEEWVDRYIDEGYDVIDNKGNVIKKSIPRDLGTLQKAYIDHIHKIEELESEIEELKTKAEQLKVKKAGRPKKE